MAERKKAFQGIYRVDWFNQLIEFLGVLLGVLFALWLTDWNEGRKEKQQIQQALENMKIEIQKNREKIDSTRAQNDLQMEFMLAFLPLLDEELEPEVPEDSIQAVIRDYPAELHPSDDGLSMDFELFQLSDVSFETLSRTGLLGAVDYDLAFRFEQTYQLQEKLAQLDQDLINQMRALKNSKESVRPVMRTVQVAQIFSQALSEQLYPMCLEGIEPIWPTNSQPPARSRRRARGFRRRNAPGAGAAGAMPAGLLPFPSACRGCASLWHSAPHRG